ncbi:MAG: hypothetical protein QOJ99_4887 [Bryobacterales bacterium]|nr:hypothetical protein [Bryobacterales bacterium]
MPHRENLSEVSRPSRKKTLKTARTAVIKPSDDRIHESLIMMRQIDCPVERKSSPVAAVTILAASVAFIIAILVRRCIGSSRPPAYDLCSRAPNFAADESPWNGTADCEYTNYVETGCNRSPACLMSTILPSFKIDSRAASITNSL